MNTYMYIFLRAAIRSLSYNVKVVFNFEDAFCQTLSRKWTGKSIPYHLWFKSLESHTCGLWEPSWDLHLVPWLACSAFEQANFTVTFHSVWSRFTNSSLTSQSLTQDCQEEGRRGWVAPMQETNARVSNICPVHFCTSPHAETVKCQGPKSYLQWLKRSETAKEKTLKIYSPPIEKITSRHCPWPFFSLPFTNSEHF